MEYLVVCQTKRRSAELCDEFCRFLRALGHAPTIQCGYSTRDTYVMRCADLKVRFISDDYPDAKRGFRGNTLTEDQLKQLMTMIERNAETYGQEES